MRSGQRDILPSALQRRGQPMGQREVAATVSNSSQADFNEIQKSIDYVNKIGGGTIYIKAGNYVQKDHIKLYSNISLVGEDFNRTFIDLIGDNKEIYADDPVNVSYSTGTIALSNGSNTGTGTGTAWLANVSAGQYLEMRGSLLKIINVIDDTTLDLEYPYDAYGGSNFPYRIMNFTENVSLSNLTIRKSSGTSSVPLAYFEQVRNLYLDKIVFENSSDNSSDSGFKVLRCLGARINNCHANNFGDRGFITTDSTLVSFINCVATNNGGFGFNTDIVTGYADNVLYLNCASTGNGGNGFYIESSSFITNCTASYNIGAGITIIGSDSILMGNWCRNNSSSGIELIDANADNTIIVGNKTNSNTEYGLTISAVASDRSVVVGNIFRDGVSNVGTGISNTSANNIGGSSIHNSNVLRMKNTSGSQRVLGDVVILKSVAAGNEFTTTTTGGDNKVLGMVLETIADNASGDVQTLGKTTALKVNGTTDIAIGDFISTLNSATIGKKASAGETAIAIALEAYTTDDSNGVIDALLISPRLI